MEKIKTASWFTKLPDDHQKVGISRGVPRGSPAGYKRFRALEPGAWFNSSTSADYLKLYGEILARLDPREVADSLLTLAPGKVPVMLCYEAPASIREGTTWCHRHLAAQWLEDKLGIEVEKVGYPSLDRFARLRMERVPPPSYR
jgi:hypothetical protein